MPVAFAVSSFGARRIPPFSSYGGILSAVDSTALFFLALRPCLHRTTRVSKSRGSKLPATPRDLSERTIGANRHPLTAPGGK
jgi:hypothetical protein